MPSPSVSIIDALDDHTIITMLRTAVRNRATRPTTNQADRKQMLKFTGPTRCHR